MSELLHILEHLIGIASISPEDKGCQHYMMNYLKTLGFDCTVFDCLPVANFFARYGTEKPLLVFAGHTDVVPAGTLQQWESDPFVLRQTGDLLYGRGVADMKGSLAAMLVMAKEFLSQHPNFSGSIGFLITSGEEGDRYDLGTPYVMKQLSKRQVAIDYCILGEPSSSMQVGDTIKVGRRGSLNARITIEGKQGHVAYPHLADNPIHKISQALTELAAKQWDEGDEYFPPTSMQITHIHAGGQANNIIPASLIMDLNFRYSPKHSEQSLIAIVTQLFADHHIKACIKWRLSGMPFLTKQSNFTAICQESIKKNTQLSPKLSTDGGTSDGRFIAPYGVEVVEIGPVNTTIHQVNECVSLTDLITLKNIYLSIAEQLFIASH